MNIEVGQTYTFVFSESLGGAHDIAQYNGQPCVVESEASRPYEGHRAFIVRFPDGVSKMAYELELKAPYVDPKLLQSVTSIRCKGVAS